MHEDREDGIWDRWNRAGGPSYPHAKLIQFCFRNYTRERREGMVALDLGCGTGVNSWFLAREGFRVCATDLSPVGIEATRERLLRDGLEADLKVESIESIGHPDGAFDLVVCIGVLECAGPQAAGKAMHEVRRVLRRGGDGIFVFAASNDFRVTGSTGFPLHGYTRPEVEEMFRGFVVVTIDQYSTTYNNGSVVQCDWLVTVRK